MSRKFLLTLLGAFFIGLPLFSQSSFTSRKVEINTGPLNNNLIGLLETIQPVQDGYFVPLRSYTDTINDQLDIGLIKLDENFGFEWMKIYEADGDDRVFSAIVSKEGQIYLCGTTRSFGSVPNGSMLARLNQNGNTDWIKTYNRGSATQIQEDGDSLLMAGQTIMLDTSVPSIYHLFLIKMDKGGNIGWTKKYSSTNEDRFNSFKKDIDGGFILSGLRNAGVAGTRADWIMLKVDKKGDVVWSKEIIGPGDENLISANGLFCFDHGYYFFNTSNSFDGGLDVTMIKFNQDGNLLWARQFDTEGYSYLRGNQMIYREGKFYGVVEGDPSYLFIADTLGNLIHTESIDLENISGFANDTIRNQLVICGSNKYPDSLKFQFYTTSYTGGLCGSTILDIQTNDVTSFLTVEPLNFVTSQGYMEDASDIISHRDTIFSEVVTCEEFYEISIFQKDTSICKGKLLSLSVSGNNISDEFTWYDQDGTEIGVGNELKIKPEESMQVIVIGEYQLSDTISINLLPNNECTLKPYQLVTPGGDGFNDFFEIENLDTFTNNELWVYNSWGNEVFHQVNYKNDWDAKNVESGTYYFNLLVDYNTTLKGAFIIIK